jgi:uncharacterized protein
MLEILNGRGEVAIAARKGRQRLRDLADRVYPADVPQLSADVAERLRNERRLRALGIARESTAGLPGEPADVAVAGEEATIEGTRGIWRVDPEALGQPFTGRTALLSPFDRLVHDRVRLAEVFEYEYTLEMYKPKGHQAAVEHQLQITSDRRRRSVNRVPEPTPVSTAEVGRHNGPRACGQRK